MPLDLDPQFKCSKCRRLWSTNQKLWSIPGRRTSEENGCPSDFLSFALESQAKTFSSGSKRRPGCSILGGVARFTPVGLTSKGHGRGLRHGKRPCVCNHLGFASMLPKCSFPAFRKHSGCRLGLHWSIILGHRNSARVAWATTPRPSPSWLRQHVRQWHDRPAEPFHTSGFPRSKIGRSVRGFSIPLCRHYRCQCFA
jgi:hypothetical protein